MVAVAPRHKRISTNATTALALGAASLLLSAVPFVGLFGLVAVALGLFAHREIGRSRGQVVGSDRATIGVTGGIVAILIGSVWTSYFVYAIATGAWSEDR